MQLLMITLSVKTFLQIQNPNLLFFIFYPVVQFLLCGTIKDKSSPSSALMEKISQQPQSLVSFNLIASVRLPSLCFHDPNLTHPNEQIINTQKPWSTELNIVIKWSNPVLTQNYCLGKLEFYFYSCGIKSWIFSTSHMILLLLSLEKTNKQTKSICFHINNEWQNTGLFLLQYWIIDFSF